MRAGVKTFNLIRQDASTVFMDTIPSATEDNIATLGNLLFDDNYAPQLNEFVSSLINRIGLTVVKDRMFDNPLGVLKKGSVPLGTDIQELYENPAEAEAYELSNTGMAKILTIADPDTKVAYYRRNRQDKYKKTIAREALRGAFVSWDKFEAFVSALINSLYSGAAIDEFKYTKDLVRGAYDNNKAIISTINAPVDESTGKAFLKRVNTLTRMMKFPSEEYNAYNKIKNPTKRMVTWTDPERIVIMLRADVIASVGTDVLAGAFQLSETNFLARLIEVDSFGDDKILGFIGDESFFQIYDNLMRADEWYNAEVMAWQYYYHVWQTFAISPFANGCILATGASKPATGISLSGSYNSVAVDGTITFTVALSPEDSTSNFTVYSTDESVFTVELSSTTATVTGVGVGSAKLIAKTDNGKTASVDISVNSPASKVELSADTMSVAGGESDTMTFTLTPADSTSTVTASSSDTDTFTVSVSNNIVTVLGVAAGSGTLTVTTDNGKTDTAAITVTGS